MEMQEKIYSQTALIMKRQEKINNQTKLVDKMHNKFNGLEQLQATIGTFLSLIPDHLYSKVVLVSRSSNGFKTVKSNYLSHLVLIMIAVYKRKV